MILKRSDINLAENSILKRKLENEGQLSNSLSYKIEEFVYSSANELVGDSWDIIRKKYLYAINALKIRKIMADDFFDLVSNVNLKLYQYLDMGGADEADDSKIPEIIQELSDAEEALAIAEAGWYSTNPLTGKTEHYVDEAEVARLKALIAELKRILEWLKKLEPTVTMTNNILNSNYSSINTYYNAILKMDE